MLTPDAIWLTLAQGFALHVNENAEALRDRFVRHDGRKTLVVHSAEGWAAAFEGFGCTPSMSGGLPLEPMPALLQQLYDVMGGGPLFGGALTLRACEQLALLPESGTALAFADLPGGTSLATVPKRGVEPGVRTSWLVIRGKKGPIESMPVLARSLLELLQRFENADAFDPKPRYGTVGDFE